MVYLFGSINGGSCGALLWCKNLFSNTKDIFGGIYY